MRTPGPGVPSSCGRMCTCSVQSVSLEGSITRQLGSMCRRYAVMHKNGTATLSDHQKCDPCHGTGHPMPTRLMSTKHACVHACGRNMVSDVANGCVGHRLYKAPAGDGSRVDSSPPAHCAAAGCVAIASYTAAKSASPCPLARAALYASFAAAATLSGCPSSSLQQQGTQRMGHALMFKAGLTH